ncbi:hypothetical protein R3P38DRAFT_2573302 [Favolaschia claudopus]|uniref:Uncharacterized protein n=1 Tax=Favolaschia claudopus TaxID=2862362 RepID=A0AAV9ZQP2_9AGAR
MAPTLPDGMTATSLITAKGAELKFWTVKTKEASEKKVLNISGTLDTLRTNLATYYYLDLTTNPRMETVTVPTVDEAIRDRQWEDFVALGVEWKEKVKAGRAFKLLTSDSGNTNSPENQCISSPLPSTSRPETHSRLFSLSSAPVIQPTPTPTPSRCVGPPDGVAQREVAILDDISTAITGLERRQGLREVIDQIESGEVQAIRDRYGPSEYGRRGTADPSWPKYSNLVSKRERLHRILTGDFSGNKERFFNFFSVPAPQNKKRKRPTDEAATPEEHFRSFRKIVEAVPWCDSELAAERRKVEYLDNNGEFCEGNWLERWGERNSWEIWRDMGKERYVNQKKSS